MKNILIIVIALAFTSCSHYKWLNKNRDKICAEYCTYPKDTTKIVYKDTTIYVSGETYVEPDLATMEMFFECDSLNQVYITKVNELNGKRINLTYILEKNKLNLKASQDSIDILWGKILNIKGIEKTVYVDREVPVVKEVPKIPAWVWITYGVLGAIIIFLTFKIVI